MIVREIGIPWRPNLLTIMMRGGGDLGEHRSGRRNPLLGRKQRQSMPRSRPSLGDVAGRLHAVHRSLEVDRITPITVLP
jgi:hypothetical protein